jgi:hypothetical protein
MLSWRQQDKTKLWNLVQLKQGLGCVEIFLDEREGMLIIKKYMKLVQSSLWRSLKIFPIIRNQYEKHKNMLHDAMHVVSLTPQLYHY